MTDHTTINRRLAELAGELEALRAFANYILDTYWLSTFYAVPPDPCGGDIQDKAAELGLLAPQVVTEACGEFCSCAEWDEFPLTCYRKTATLAARGTEGGAQ